MRRGRQLSVGEHERSHNAVVRVSSRRRFFQPSLVAFLKGKISFGRIENFSAWINTGFGGIWFDQGLGEAMDRGACKLVECFKGVARCWFACSAVIPLGKAIEISRGTSPRARLDAKRSIRIISSLAANSVKAYGGNIFWLDPVGEQNNDTTGHKGRFSRAGASLDQERAVRWR